MKQSEFEPKITAKGTRLPIMNLKGKPYLMVAHRLVWFREDHPDFSIESFPVKVEADYAVMQAQVKDASGRILAVGHKKETQENFFDFIEKAETGAIGRALAIAGYGTQFEPEFDEQERLADAPVESPERAPTEAKAKRVAKAKTAPPTPEATSTTELAKASSREETLKGIKSVVSVLVAQKKITKAAVAEYAKVQFNEGDPAKLTDEQLTSVYSYLGTVLNGPAQ